LLILLKKAAQIGRDNTSASLDYTYGEPYAALEYDEKDAEKDLLQLIKKL